MVLSWMENVMSDLIWKLRMRFVSTLDGVLWVGGILLMAWCVRYFGVYLMTGQFPAVIP